MPTTLAPAVAEAVATVGEAPALTITVAAGTLNQHLSIVSRAVPSRPNQPILANVLLVAEAGRVYLSGFDLTFGIRSSFEAEVSKPFSTTLPSKLLSDVVSRLDPEAVLTVELQGSGVILTTGSGKYDIRGLAPDEYPELPMGQGECVELEPKPFAEALAKTLFATSADETKQVLTGVHLKASAGWLEFAATDGHRLAVVVVPQEVESTSFEITVPSRVFRELERIISGSAGEKLKLYYEEGQAVFQWGDQLLTSRLLDGQYPNYETLIPKAFERSAIASRKQLLTCLERVAVLADQKNSVVKLSLSDAGLLVSADAQDVGKGQEELNLNVFKGEALSLAFNVRYLLDVLKAIDTEELELRLGSALSPAILAPVNGGDFTCLLMPVQVRS